MCVCVGGGGTNTLPYRFSIVRRVNPIVAFAPALVVFSIVPHLPSTSAAHAESSSHSFLHFSSSAGFPRMSPLLAWHARKSWPATFVSSSSFHDRTAAPSNIVPGSIGVFRGAETPGAGFAGLEGFAGIVVAVVVVVVVFVVFAVTFGAAALTGGRSAFVGPFFRATTDGSLARVALGAAPGALEPQSVQSLPSSQSSDLDAGPPSSQLPSPLNWHESSQCVATEAKRKAAAPPWAALPGQSSWGRREAGE